MTDYTFKDKYGYFVGRDDLVIYKDSIYRVNSVAAVDPTINGYAIMIQKYDELLSTFSNEKSKLGVLHGVFTNNFLIKYSFPPEVPDKAPAAVFAYQNPAGFFGKLYSSIGPAKSARTSYLNRVRDRSKPSGDVWRGTISWKKVDLT